MMEPTIKQLIQAEDEALDVYKAFALLWVAAADGVLNPIALNYLYHHHSSLPRALDRADKLLAIIANHELSSFLLASRGLQNNFPSDDKSAFLQSAIATGTASGKLSIATNHILRFLADLLDCGEQHLAAIYREQTREELPEPGDPSSLAWWQAKTESHLPGDRNEAFAVLGLASGASNKEVKQAYRRLVQSHHPDRVVNLGNVARKAAEVKFMQVQQAYEVLRK